MRRRIHGLVATALAVMTLSAHAGLFGPDEKEGAKEACFKRHSRAWCTYDAADLSKNLKDLRQTDVLKAMKGGTSGPSAETVIDVAMVGATLAGAFTVAPGFSSPGEAAMLALDLLFRTNTPRIAKENVTFGWMPYDMAATPEAAAENIFQVVDQATRSAFKDYFLESLTMQAMIEDRGYSLDRFETLAYSVKGGDCDAAQCFLLQYRPKALDLYVWLPRPVETKAPEWLGGYKAWFFHGPVLRELRINDEYVSQRYFGRVSRELPAWVFVSVSPQSSHYSKEFNRGQKLPLLFNQGKPMATVFPEMEIRTDPDAELKLVRPKPSAPADAAK